MAIQSISEGQSNRKAYSYELHKIILAQVQKGYKLLLKKIKSAFSVKMHIYTLCPSLQQRFTKFCTCWAISVELCWRTLIFKFKKGLYSQKKRWIKISCGYAHLHIMSFITTKFYEILLSGFRGVALTNCDSSIFHFGQISKLKKGVTPRKKIESKLSVDMHIYILSPS